jgi:hypothetical protein
MTFRLRNQPVPSNPDASREIPDDIEAIAAGIPTVPRGFAALRQLIGLLPDPIGPSFPNHPPLDANAGQTAPTTSGIVGTAFGYGVQGSGAGGVFNISSIDGSQIAGGSVSGEQLSANSVSADKIQANSITADKIQANSITSDKIQANTIQASDIQVGTITGLELADGSISPVEIAYLDASDITVGTLTGINIIAGGGGNDGFHVANASGGTIGSWTSGLGLEADSVFSDTFIYATTTVTGTQGVGTATVSGIGSAYSTNDGMLYIDTASSPARFYFRHSGGWHYVNQTAGFGIPAYEARCPVCGEVILPGEDLIGVASTIQHDGAVHGLWKHLRCQGLPLGPLAAQYEAAANDAALQAELEAEVHAAQDAAGVVRPELPAVVAPRIAAPDTPMPPEGLPSPVMGTKIGLTQEEADARQAAKEAEYQANIDASEAARAQEPPVATPASREEPDGAAQGPGETAPAQ